MHRLRSQPWWGDCSCPLEALRNTLSRDLDWGDSAVPALSSEKGSSGAQSEERQQQESS